MAACAIRPGRSGSSRLKSRKVAPPKKGGASHVSDGDTETGIGRISRALACENIAIFV